MRPWGVGLVLGIWLGPGCTFHHTKDEQPFRTTLAGAEATVEVERAPAPRGAERILVRLNHGDGVDLLAVAHDVVLQGAGGSELSICSRTSIDRLRLAFAEERQETRIQFLCKWPLTQSVWLRTPAEAVPVLGPSGLQVMGSRPWLLSGWIRGELGARVTGPVTSQGVDLGANFGGRGLLFSHLGIGGRADLLIDSKTAAPQFLIGPEAGYVHSSWPCDRCSVEMNLSYLIGYARGFAHGPQADVLFGVRIFRSAENWHGVSAGVGYRHLFGPESGGSVVVSLSYTIQTALRWAFLPNSIRAKERELQAPPELPKAPEQRDDPPEEVPVN